VDPDDDPTGAGPTIACVWRLAAAVTCLLRSGRPRSMELRGAAARVHVTARSDGALDCRAVPVGRVGSVGSPPFEGGGAAA
jgi:hypothetical protein